MMGAAHKLIYPLLLLLLGPVFLGWIAYHIFWDLHGYGWGKLAEHIPALLLLLICCLLTIYLIYVLLVAFPLFNLSSSGISRTNIRGRQVLEWQEIASVQQGVKRQIPGIGIPLRLEACVLQLKDGKELLFFPAFYSNGPQVSLLLEKTMKILEERKIEDTDLQFRINVSKGRIGYGSIIINDEDEFNRNHLFSFNGLLFYGWILLLISTYWIIPSRQLFHFGTMFALATASFFILWLAAFQMHYFIVNNDFFIAENSLLPNSTRIYPFSEIREIVLEEQIPFTISVRVIGKDCRHRIFPSGNLSMRQWKALKAKLEAVGIAVRVSDIQELA